MIFRDVERSFKLFTFKPLDEIADIMVKHNEKSDLRQDQQTLAVDVCKVDLINLR